MRLTKDERRAGRNFTSRRLLTRSLQCVVSVLLGGPGVAGRRLSRPSGCCGGSQRFWRPTSRSGEANASIRSH